MTTTGMAADLIEAHVQEIGELRSRVTELEAVVAKARDEYRKLLNATKETA